MIQFNSMLRLSKVLLEEVSKRMRKAETAHLITAYQMVVDLEIYIYQVNKFNKLGNLSKNGVLNPAPFRVLKVI